MVQTKYLRSCLCPNKYSGIMGKVEMFPQKRPTEIHQRVPGNRAFRTTSCRMGEEDSKLPSLSSLEWDPDFNCTVQVGFLPEGILWKKGMFQLSLLFTWLCDIFQSPFLNPPYHLFRTVFNPKPQRKVKQKSVLWQLKLYYWWVKYSMIMAPYYYWHGTEGLGSKWCYQCSGALNSTKVTGIMLTALGFCIS